MSVTDYSQLNDWHNRQVQQAIVIHCILRDRVSRRKANVCMEGY